IVGAGIITPGRVPIAGIPVIRCSKHEDDAVVARSPPPLIVPFRMVILENYVLRASPVLSAIDPVISIKPHRLVAWVRIIRQIEVLLLKFPWEFPPPFSFGE